MVECLIREARRLDIHIRERLEVVRLLSDRDRIVGALFIDLARIDEPGFGLGCVVAENVVFGVGGPAGLYRDSVYPHRHTGAIGLALELGVEAANLTESQFGLASIQHPWNVSGTFQQVLPRYISTKADGTDPQEFLLPEFPRIDMLLEAVFLKGYQWPFDARRVSNHGSSLIDELVYRETAIRGRKVYLDYRSNPTGTGEAGVLDPATLPDVVRDYLENSSALSGSPFDRLAIMNPAAIAMYRSHNIDLESEPLEISVCAQHNNGGLAADSWWESTSHSHFFPVGEVNGSHGVYRPGGSALNAGQVGSMRAAERIRRCYSGESLSRDDVVDRLRPSIAEFRGFIDLAAAGSDRRQAVNDIRDLKARMRARMSDYAGHRRRTQGIDDALGDARSDFQRLADIQVPREFLPALLRLRHQMIAQLSYLSTVRWYVASGRGSRGSYVVLESSGEYRPPADGQESEVIVTQLASADIIHHSVIPRRPLPEQTPWFETAWGRYRSGEIFGCQTED
jgi:succinate dehydrogenase/fumarate reductase flavoprotein subunit